MPARREGDALRFPSSVSTNVSSGFAAGARTNDVRARRSAPKQAYRSSRRRVLRRGRTCRHFSSSLPSLSFCSCLLERDRLAVADDFEPRRVEARASKRSFWRNSERVLLQIVDERRLDGEDRRPRQVPGVDGALGGRLADRERRLRRAGPIRTVAAGLSSPYFFRSRVRRDRLHLQRRRARRPALRPRRNPLAARPAP